MEQQAGFFARAATAMGVPIAVRELAVAGRRARTYALRASVALGLGSIVLVVIFFSRIDSSGADANLGLRLFWWFSWMAMMIVVLMGPITAGGSIAEERRENTLGLLFLTDLRPGGIAFGKFFSAATFMLQLLLVGTPVLFSGVILGGVELDQTLHVFAIIVSTALAAIAIGLCAGTLTESTVGSIFVALFATGAVLVLPILGAALLGGVVARMTGSPLPGQVATLIYEVNPFVALDAELVAGGSDLWWRSVALCCGIALVALVLAGFRLGALRRASTPRQGTVGGAAKRFKRKRPPYSEVKNPVYEMELRHASGTLERVLRVAIYVGGPLAAAATPALVWIDDAFAGIMLMVYVMLGMFLGLVVGVVAAMSLGQEREDGTLELLLTTSMRPYNIVNGKVVAIGRRLGLPFLVLQILFVLGAGMAVAVMVGKSTTMGNQGSQMFLLVGFTVAAALFAAGMQIVHAASLAFIAMAIGVRAQARTALAALAAVVGIFVTSMCLCSCLYISLCVASAEVIAAAICYHDLTRHLRKYALRR